MELLPLTFSCPNCGSPDVAYSCEPECCFNHVCGDCLSSFEPFTSDLGGELAVGRAGSPEKDSCAPTVACARCGGLEVLALAGEGSENRVVCGDCRALLVLGFSTV